LADERLDVTRFVIRHAVLPAPPEDADPFKRECAQDRLVVLAGTFLLEVIRSGPGGFGDGLTGPLHPGLAEELWSVPSPVDPDLPTTALGDRCDSGVFLQAGGVGMSGAHGAERHEQSRRQRRPAPGRSR